MHISKTNYSNPYSQGDNFQNQKRMNPKKSISKIVDLFELSHDYQKDVEILELEFMSLRIFQLPECREQKMTEVKEKLNRNFYRGKSLTRKIVDRLIAQNCL